MSGQPSKSKGARAKGPRPGPRQVPVYAGPKRQPAVWKVYVSGFHDWPTTKKEAVGFNPWKCLQNPSGRLFIGRWHNANTKPDATRGPLPRALRTIRRTNDGRTVDWTFDTLPVRWGIARSIRARDYDVVVNLGYGVYNSRTRLLLERGAYNGRAGQPGADGKVPGDPGGPATRIDAAAGATLASPQHIRTTLNGANGNIRVGNTTYAPRVTAARRTNDYICNETHYIMLRQVNPNRRLRQTYFIHIPKPANAAGYRSLAAALKILIERLIQP